jgi:hypothetical protein
MKVQELLETKCCPEPEELLEDSPVEPIMEAEYQGKTVELNKPKRGGTRKFYVYVKNDKGNVIKVAFGDPNGEVANNDPKRAASFRARHKCAEEHDKTSANYWSCNVARYAKSLGLSSSRPW